MLRHLVATMITRLTVRNFRCLAALQLDLGPLTVLVGANGTGKSTILDVPVFVTEALRDTLPTALERRGGIRGVRRHSAGHPTHVGIGLTFEDPTRRVSGRYAFEIRAERDYGFSVSWEKGKVQQFMGEEAKFSRVNRKLRTDVAGVSPKLDRMRLALPLLAGSEPFGALYDELTRAVKYAIEPRLLHDTQEPDEGSLLRSDGSNVASILRVLRRDHGERYERLREELSAIVPAVQDIESRTVGNKLALAFKMDVGQKYPWEFESFAMSDGTLRVLGILLALAQRPQPNPICLEEPEATVHPGALVSLLSAVKEVADETQIIISTHSPDVLERCEADELRCVRMIGGRTVVSPISVAAREAIKKELMLPGELMRSNALEPDDEEMLRHEPSDSQLKLFDEGNEPC